MTFAGGMTTIMRTTPVEKKHRLTVLSGKDKGESKQDSEDASDDLSRE
jgi:hypothetical protein